MVLVLIAVSFLTFFIFIILPGGDPAVRIAGRTATQQNIRNIRETWGFDQPFYVQYANMMKKAFNGLRPGCCEGRFSELRSYTNQLNVVDQIKAGLPATFSLSIGAGIVWLFFGVVVGAIAAASAGKLSDRMITVLALIGISMPVFWLGLVARYYLAEKNAWFPDGNYIPISEDLWQWFWHLVLPWCVLAVLFIGFYGRVLRSNILDSIHEDYVRTARAKGLAPRRVLLRHVLRNSLIPIVTLFGLDFAAVLGGGAILTETVFDLHGVGWYASQSITNLDLPPLIGVTIYGAFFIVLFTAIVDLVYGLLDPRIRGAA